MFKKILLAADGSEGSLKAAEAAADLARVFAAPVVALYVFSPPSGFVPVDNLMGADIDSAEQQRLAEEAKNAVSCRIGKVMEGRGGGGVTYTLRQEVGHPAEVIVRVAEQEHFDLIVMGSRGLSGIKRFLLGSVSDRVSHHAPCSVLIIK